MSVRGGREGGATNGRSVQGVSKGRVGEDGAEVRGKIEALGGNKSGGTPEVTSPRTHIETAIQTEGADETTAPPDENEARPPTRTRILITQTEGALDETTAAPEEDPTRERGKVQTEATLEALTEDRNGGRTAPPEETPTRKGEEEHICTSGWIGHDEYATTTHICRDSRRITQGSG